MAFGDFGKAQKALSKFFESEPVGDAQYVLVTIGREANFSRVFLDSEASNLSMLVNRAVRVSDEDLLRKMRLR